MYKIYFYRDEKGREPVKEYIDNLSRKKDKNSQIKANKINDYLTLLMNCVTQNRTTCYKIYWK